MDKAKETILAMSSGGYNFAIGKLCTMKLLQNGNVKEVIELADQIVNPSYARCFFIEVIVDYMIEHGDLDGALDKLTEISEYCDGSKLISVLALIAKNQIKKGNEKSGRDLFEKAKSFVKPTNTSSNKFEFIARMELECGLFKEAKTIAALIQSKNTKCSIYLKIAQNEGFANQGNAKKTLKSAKSAINYVKDLKIYTTVMLEIWDTQIQWGDDAEAAITLNEISSNLSKNLLEEIQKTQIECDDYSDLETVKVRLRELDLVSKEQIKMLFMQSKAFIKIANVHGKILGDHDIFFEIIELAMVVLDKLSETQYKDMFLRELAKALAGMGYFVMAVMKAEKIVNPIEKVNSLLEICKAIANSKPS